MRDAGIRGRAALVAAAAAAAVVLAADRAALAVDRYFVGANGSFWNNISNWSATSGGAGGQSVPANGDLAYLTFTTSKQVNFDGNYTFPGLSRLFVYGSGGAIATLNQSANSMWAMDQFIGGWFSSVDPTLQGTYNQTGGSNNAQQLYLGYNGSQTGTYALNGAAATLTTGTAYIGLLGNGTVNHFNGTHTSTLSYIGLLAGSSGTYNMQGGSWNAPTILVGYQGSGTLNHYNGTTSVSNSLRIGDQPASLGTFNLSFGSFTAPEQVVGTYGTGVVKQTGGTNTATAGIYVGATAAATGTYTLSGGSINPSGPGGLLVVGESGRGTFDQLNGDIHANNLIIGWHGGSLGTYFLRNSAYLEVNGPVHIGLTGAGSVVQSGGFAAFNGATYIQAAGQGGTGSYEMTGGTLSANALTNSGTYEQSAGTFSGVFQNNATMILRGGTMNSGTGGGSVAGITNSAAFELYGGTVGGNAVIVNDGQLNVRGAAAIAGAGGFRNDGSLNFAGPFTLTLSNPGANANNGTIDLSPGAQLRLSFAALSNAATINLNGGSVTQSGGGTLNNTGLITGRGTIATNVFNNAGAVVLADGTTSLANAFTNNGLVDLTSATSNLTGGVITNHFGGTIQGRGSVGNAINNTNGTIEAIGGTLRLGGAVSNSAGGTMSATAGAKLLVQNMPTSDGVINLTGGTFDTAGGTLFNGGQISGHGIVRTEGLTNGGTIVLTGGNTTVNGPVVNNATKRIAVRFNPALFTGDVTNNGTFEVTGTTVTFAGAGPALAAGATPKELAPRAGVLGTGVTTVDATGQILTDTVRQAQLSSAGRVEIRATAAGGQTSVLGQLSLTGAGTLALNDNDLLIDYTGASVQGEVRQWVRNGRSGGTGITTLATPANDTVLAVADNAEWGKTAFGAFTIDSSTVVGKYTYFGDANLDGAVTGDDYLAIDAGLGIGDDWIEGDFNMSGTVTGDDYLAIDANLGKGTPTPLAWAALKEDMVALHASMFGEEYLVKLADVEVNGFATVPEPRALGLVGLACLGGLRRRRRKN